jgi:hypothetical protein
VSEPQPHPSHPLGRWTEAVCALLGLPAAAVHRDLVLDLARDVAHGVARPAAPLTAYLVGLAAGRAGAVDDPEVARRLVERVAELAAGFDAPAGPPVGAAGG